MKKKDEIFAPKPHQKEALKCILDCKHGLKNDDRVQFISACGTGKTLTLLWSAENYLAYSRNLHWSDIKKVRDGVVIFLFPSLSLINQSYESYMVQKSIYGYRPFVVCSDDKITAKANEEDTAEDCAFPVSTNQQEIEKYLNNESVLNKVIFSTYKSAYLVGNALKRVGVVADITVYDEAHRTAIKNEKEKDAPMTQISSGWSLLDEHFPSKKRLFATATPKHYNLSDNYLEQGNIAYSMDNKEYYGEIAHEYSMRKAINDGQITDYKILAIMVTSQEVRNFLRPLTSKGNINHLTNKFMQDVALILAIDSARKKYGLNAALAFHSSIGNSKNFVNNFKLHKSEFACNIGHIDGKMNHKDKEKLLEVLESDEFSLLSNAKLLSEGQDVPELDLVVFANMINSAIDIVQRIGRCQRVDKQNKNKIGYVLLPIYIDDINQDIDEALKDNKGLSTLFTTVNSLKETDEQLRNTVNLAGKKKKEHDGQGSLFGDDSNIVITSTNEINKEFEEKEGEDDSSLDGEGSSDNSGNSTVSDGVSKGTNTDTNGSSDKKDEDDKTQEGQKESFAVDAAFQEMLKEWESGIEAALVGEPIKRDTAMFIQEAKEVHGDKYDYSKTKYVNTSTKVIIICPVHGEFEQNPSSHLQGHSCPKCYGMNKTTEEWIKEAKEVHGKNTFDYSKTKYINGSTKVTIICPTHGKFEQNPYDHINGTKCSKCAHKSKTTEEWIKEAKEVHGDKYDYSKTKYVNTSTKVTIICPEHGEFEQNPYKHLNGAKCPKCYGMNKTTEEWIKEAKEVHGDKYDYSKVKYINAKTKVTIICPEHGEFEQNPYNLLRGYGCLKCTKEKKRKKMINEIVDYLSKNSLNALNKNSVKLKYFRAKQITKFNKLTDDADKMEMIKEFSALPLEFLGKRATEFFKKR